METLADNSRVLLINDDPFELATLSASLRLHSTNVVGEALDTLIAQNLFSSLRPEVVLIDLQYSGEECIRVLQKFRKANPEVGIVIMTSCPDLRLFGLQLKDIPKGSLVILKKSAADLSIVTRSLRESILAAKDGREISWINHDGSPLFDFTDVQVETLRMLSEGLSNSEIARIRFVSEKSVEQTVARIAQHIGITQDRTHNLRAVLTAEFFKWLGSPRR